jgi:hypothetical protein
MSKKEFLIYLCLAVGLLAFAIFAGGCTKCHYTRTDFYESGNVKAHIEVEFDELLMDSEMGGFHAKVDGEKREFIIGEVYREPDANVIGGIIAGIMAAWGVE